MVKLLLAYLSMPLGTTFKSNGRFVNRFVFALETIRLLQGTTYLKF